MEKDLHKWLEEAADRHCKCDACLSEHKATGGCWKEICPAHSAYIAGGEYGYKEAIAQAKEFAIKYIADWNMVIAQKYYSSKGRPSIVEVTMSHGEFCRKLEEHINKLWEGEK